MQYLAWRVMAGLNKRIEISFMMVGHTKFAPDWAFGLLKQKFRRTLVGCLEDMARVVDNSAIVNHAQPVGMENGEVIVRQYDWAKFFATYYKRQAFEGIKSLHHLVFDHLTPGKVLVRKETDGEADTLQVLTKAHLLWSPSPDTLPDEIIPPGLSLERKRYLYEKIREFVPEESRDIVCPNPNTTPTSPTMGSLNCPPAPSPAPLSQPPSPSPSPPPPRPKRRRHGH